LEAIAYRLLGSAGDAEDAGQDAFLRWHAADRERIETPEAWLTRVLVNLCLNQRSPRRGPGGKPMWGSGSRSRS
jgi:RNA polymerase sigma-70 factor (ECF subfamily)